VSLPIPYAIKRQLRIWDSRLSPGRVKVRFRGRDFQFYRTYWWADASQKLIDEEIAPYFDALEENFDPEVVLDVGAATGAFAILAARLFPRATIYCFEPAERQRILLQRNARLNGVENIEMVPFGLWDSEKTVAFRSNGAESSFFPVSRFRDTLPFPEQVPVLPLDRWTKSKGLGRVDLVKMDAEGAELEILEGAQDTLRKFHPWLLVQAYHLRDGVRTFERCADIISRYSYSVAEDKSYPGCLIARSNGLSNL
jgi:FkbM family methyltransferase